MNILTSGESRFPRSPLALAPALTWSLFRPICLPEAEDEALDLAGLDQTGITVGWGVTKVLRYQSLQCDYVKGMYDTTSVSHKLKKINLK